MNKPDRILTDAASYRAERPLVSVNGRAYAWPKHPAVVICFDGCDPTYIESASAAGAIPAIDRMRRGRLQLPPRWRQCRHSPTPTTCPSSAVWRPPFMVSPAISISTAIPARKS